VTHRLIIEDTEEAVRFVLVSDDKTENTIGNFNYDDHGSRAMADAGRAIEKFATFLNIPIEYRDPVEESEDPDADPLGD